MSCFDFFCPPVRGVSICPRNCRESLGIRYSTVIVCESRAIINLNCNGITRVFSNRGPASDGDYVVSTEDEPNEPISYIRVFPARAQVVFDRQGQSYVQIDGRNYLHGRGIDLIVATQRINHQYVFLGDGEHVEL